MLFIFHTFLQHRTAFPTKNAIYYVSNRILRDSFNGITIWCAHAFFPTHLVLSYRCFYQQSTFIVYLNFNYTMHTSTTVHIDLMLPWREGRKIALKQAKSNRQIGHPKTLLESKKPTCEDSSLQKTRSLGRTHHVEIVSFPEMYGAWDEPADEVTAAAVVRIHLRKRHLKI